MGQALRVTDSAASNSSFRFPQAATAVGASYSFDPGADGLAGIYATRLLERGVDPRALCAEVRADRLGVSERGATIRTLMERPRVSRFGRGTAKHLQAQAAEVSHPTRPAAVPARLPASRMADFGRTARQPAMRWPRRLAAAGLALLLLLPLGVIAANAEGAPQQARYIVREGDTLESVAAEFGVDPAAILAASAIQNPPYLTPAEVIVIPDPAESPDTAAWNAFQLQGSSPFVVGAHDVAPGETLAAISWNYGLDPWALAAFNGISDVESLSVGQRLRIPLTDVVTMPDDTWESETLPASTPGEWEESWTESAADAVGGGSGWEEPASGPVFAAEVPAYMQMYSLSCEYAAAYIATAAFGYGVPESAFLERIGQSANPHWGYRGDIAGAWGGTDDYGIYAEALVPTLNEFGYVADVFYGGDPGSLTARLDAGMPVMTWLGYFGDTAWQQNDEGSYLLAPGMHVVTVYGYDEGGVYLSNPGRGAHDYYSWDEFLAKWAVIDGMGLAIAPM
jgi:LysM repeat protein/uncharacterized protein YvpB